MHRFRSLAGLAMLVVAAPALAKPISYQNGTTAVFDYMPHQQEGQIFYAPDVRTSLGAGYLRIERPTDGGHQHGGGVTGSLDIAYVRLNVLAQRWNGSDSQANAYFWAGLGTADNADRAGVDTVPNAGVQFDAESRRFYGSLKSDWHSTFDFTQGTTVLQLGVAPYLHEYNGIATWIVAQGHNMHGTEHRETRAALLLRMFWRGLWGEAGVDDQGELLGLLMINL